MLICVENMSHSRLRNMRKNDNKRTTNAIPHHIPYPASLNILPLAAEPDSKSQTHSYTD